MFEFPMLRFFLGFLVAALPGAFASDAEVAPIQDNGGFFSERAKVKASQNITELERSYQKGFVLETFNAIPDEMKQGVNLQDQAAVNRLFGKWARKRAKEKAVNGVYVLLVREFSHIHAVVDDETQKRAFTFKNRDVLVSRMLEQLGKKKNDEALLDGVAFVFATIKIHASDSPRAAPTDASAPAASGSSSGRILQVVLALVAAWIIISIIRLLLEGRRAGRDA